jgi:hypothetical protein
MFCVVPNQQNTKLEKEERKKKRKKKRKKVCTSYLSLALQTSLALYSKFRTSCLRLNTKVPKTKVPKTVILILQSQYRIQVDKYRTDFRVFLITDSILVVFCIYPDI